VFRENYNLDEETAYKLTAGLGGGFRSGEVCGAISAAILVVGLKHGQSKADDLNAKVNCNAKTIEFINRFRETNETIICRELLGVDPSTEEGRKYAQENNLFRQKCDEIVKTAISILEESGY